MTNTKDLERMRAICKALDPDFIEAPHFGGVVFKTHAKKIFTSYGDKNGVVVQLEAKHAKELLADPSFERYARAKDTVMFDPTEIGWTKARALVAESHRLVVARSKKPTKKTKSKKR